MISGYDIVQCLIGHFHFHANSIEQNGHGTNLGDRNTMGIFDVRSSKTFKSKDRKRSWSGAGLVRE